jgi:hypothetical protein
MLAETVPVNRCSDLGEGAVFEAVVAVSSLAHRLLVETPRPGEVELSVIRLKAGRGLEARVLLARGSGAPTTAASVVIPPARMYS